MRKFPSLLTVLSTGTLLCFVILPWVAAQEDARPVVDEKTLAPQSKADPKLPDLLIVGDSTLRSNAPLRGWGDEMAPFFDTTKLNVINRAIGGRSSRTFQNEGRWDKVLAELKPEDYVLVQFGHNDAGVWNDPGAKNRPSLHGEGEETQPTVRPDGATETIHSFGWYMRKYGTDAKAKGAHAVFCSQVPHMRWHDNLINRGERDSFVPWTAAAAKATGAGFINLNEAVALEYEKLGPEKVLPLFADKGTHTSPAGAEFNARNVVAGLRALPGAPLDRYLSEKGKQVAPLAATLVVGP